MGIFFVCLIRFLIKRKAFVTPVCVNLDEEDTSMKYRGKADAVEILAGTILKENALSTRESSCISDIEACMIFIRSRDED